MVFFKLSNTIFQNTLSANATLVLSSLSYFRIWPEAVWGAARLKNAYSITQRLKESRVKRDTCSQAVK